MLGEQELAEPTQVATGRWMARTAVAAIGASVALMVIRGVEGTGAFPPAPPWPPWFFHFLSPVLGSLSQWLVELLAASGLAFALLAVQRGWRPRPRRLMLGSVVAVIALTVTPPVANGDPVMYAAFGRISAMGHSPYVMTPGQLRRSGDPVGAAVAPAYWTLPSRYGPVATLTEKAASELAGDSVARTIFWLKVWNALAYLALVLALDRAVRSDASRRVRAHVLWSVNPLMLWALLANGHNDVLAAAAGVSALFALRRVDSLRPLLAGALLGLAAAIKADYLVFGAGLAWAARRLPYALVAVALGVAAILVPSYLVGGRVAISATLGLARVKPNGQWLDVARALGWQHDIVRINDLGLAASVALAVILLWRMPSGPRDLPAVRVGLALALGLLIASALQAAWYDAMIFPLLAVMPASRLDWIAVTRAAAWAVASAPYFNRLDPTWLTVIEKVSVAGSPTLILDAVDIALLWLCVTRAWNPAASQVGFRRTTASAEVRQVPLWT
jgi:alpha-1,6-mannosyltransferase